jgi:hypothetical protein
VHERTVHALVAGTKDEVKRRLHLDEVDTDELLLDSTGQEAGRGKTGTEQTAHSGSRASARPAVQTRPPIYPTPDSSSRARTRRATRWPDPFNWRVSACVGGAERPAS